MISEATFRDLELPALLAVVAELAATDLGRDRLLALRPCASRSELEGTRGRYAEVGALLGGEGSLVPVAEEPLGPVLSDLETGRGNPGGRELLRIADLLGVSAALRRRVAEADPPTPLLASRIEALPDLEALRRRIAGALDRRGGVRDDASPRLVSLRRTIRRDRDGLYGQLGELVRSRRDLLTEETVSQREGRLVVLLKAGSRGRVPGLVHGRSGTGQSFYFEPLETVEANNSLQQSLSDEEEERNRILRELLEAAREELPALRHHAEVAADIDLLQAAFRFGELLGGRQIELGEEPRIRLHAARHPLLDPAGANLREAALGHPGHRAPVVPLEMEIAPPQRALVITGPNAGGKTVALKTLGLLALAAHCGLPVPVGEGSRMPFLARVVAAIGDEQDLLAERSTFSGRLLRLREAWEEAGERTLVLLDELGSGTDPEEGAALASAALEGLVGRGCWVVATTHLVRVAAVALDLPGAGCAAMEFDAAGVGPTYRLVPGAPGGSEAIALARRLALPDELVSAAEARLGGEHRELRRLLAEVESLRSQLAAEGEALAAQRRDAEILRRRLEEDRTALEEERERVGRRMRAELEAFRRETRERFGSEVETLRRELEKGRRRDLAARATARVFESAPQPRESPPSETPPEPGDTVRHRALGWEGVLEKVDRGRAEVVVRGKRLRCRIEELATLPGQAPERRRSEVAGPEIDEPAPRELLLLGQRVEEALLALDEYLDRALLGPCDELRVVHGHGTGRLRRAVREHLRRHPAVASMRGGGPGEGGDGVTVVRLRSA